MVFVWSALKRGLLERLENLPIRFAFDRLKVMGWMTMLSQAELREHWRDMARSRESMQQMLHQQDLRDSMKESEWCELQNLNTKVAEQIKQLGSPVAKPADRPINPQSQLIALQAAEPSAVLPERRGREPHVIPGVRRPEYDSMSRIEGHFAEFSQGLLKWVLIPYWRNTRTGLVESEEVEELPITPKLSPLGAQRPYIPLELQAGPSSSEPAHALAAEEFVAIRYMSLIHAVLANMRHLMLFVSVSFVLAIMAWNSYPFQPRQQVDWLFTGLLALLGSGMVWVFAQMHRDPILSRITDTKANELGWDFYRRVISFGALPVLTWLAYQFPDVGNVIAKFIVPTVPVVHRMH